MPDEEFGKRVLGRPQFVEQLAGLQTMTFEAADRLLRFLGDAPIGPVFRRVVEAFLDVTAIRPAKLSTEAAGYPWFVGTLEERGSARLIAVERVRAWMVEAATPSELAAIASMLEDSGSTIFNDGASASMQGERRENDLSGVRRGQGCPRPCSQGSPPVVPHYKRSGDAPQACPAHAGPLLHGPRGSCVLQAWKSGVLCARRPSDLGLDTAREYRLMSAPERDRQTASTA